MPVPVDPSSQVDAPKQGLFRISRESCCAVRLAFDQWSFRITPARLILLALTAAAVAILILRLLLGLGGHVPVLGYVTHLTDDWPWGLWITRDLCGVALAGGGYGTALMLYVLGNGKLKPIARATLLSSLIGYILVVTSLFIEIGRYWNFWRPATNPGHESILFEVFICVSLYTIVQTLKLCEIITEKVFCMFHRFFVTVMPFLLIVGIVLPTLHQSSLGALYLMMDEKLHPLWFSSHIFIFFLLSSFFVGPAMIAVESVLAYFAYKRLAPLPVLKMLAKIGGWMMVIYLVLKFADLAYHEKLHLIFDGSYESVAFMAEIGIGILLPLCIVFTPLVNYRVWIVVYGFLTAFGVVMNRMNVIMIGMSRTADTPYFPSGMEIVLTIGLVTGGILVYMFLCENFNILGAYEKVDEKTEPVA